LFSLVLCFGLCGLLVLVLFLLMGIVNGAVVEMVAVAEEDLNLMIWTSLAKLTVVVCF
jgi:hypothetical protein